MLKRCIGKIKRDGYTFHSFLQSDRAYINTGLIMTGFIAKFKCSWSATNGYFVGSHNSSSPFARQGFYLRGNSEWELGLFETSNIIKYSGVTNKVYDIEFSTDASNGYAILDGVKLIEGISTTPTEPKSTITLFKMGSLSIITRGKLFETWIYDLNRNIVAHYLPTSRDSDGVCGMYDLVTDTFLTNANTVGTFTVGEEKDFYEWKEIKEIKRLKTPRLPKEYQEVEYIESTGTQWIDTGIIARYGYDINIKMSYKKNNNGSSDQSIFFARSDSGDSRFGLQLSSIQNASYTPSRVLYGQNKYLLGSNYSITENRIFTVRYTLFYGRQETYVDEIVTYNDESIAYKNQTEELRCTLPAYLFAGNYYGNAMYHSSARVYEFRVKDENGEYIYYYIPCYRKSDGEVGIYDALNNVFLTNQGSGTFLKGEDVKFDTIKKINKVIEGEIKTIYLNG